MHDCLPHVDGVPDRLGRGAASSASATEISLRDLMPGFANTLRRCHSTVCELLNSWAPTSGFVSPPAASGAICAS